MSIDRVKKLARNLKNIKPIMEQAMIESIRENSEQIEDLNIAQLEKGEDSLGNAIRPEYRNPDYAAFKQFINSKPPSGTPDLILEGDFSKSIYIKSVSNRNIIWDATDKKAEELTTKYGTEVLGVRDGRKILEIIRFDLLDKAKRRIL